LIPESIHNKEHATDSAGDEAQAERVNERWSSLRSSNVATNTSAAETFLATLGEDQVLVVRAVINNARVPILHSSDDLARRELRRQVHLRGPWVDKEFALKISVKAAIRERGEEARAVIEAELQQMLDKQV
jgi:hypothetical protein